MQAPTNRIRVLSVEDNPADTLMISSMLQNSKLVSDLDSVADGAEAIDFLKRNGKFKEADRPDLILLDLNLPKKDGRQVLKEIKQDPDLACIPVMILSTSDSPKDVHTAYQLHANAYFTKPSDLAQFRLAIQAIEDFWSRTALPHQVGTSFHPKN